MIRKKIRKVIMKVIMIRKSIDDLVILSSRVGCQQSSDQWFCKTQRSASGANFLQIQASLRRHWQQLLWVCKELQHLVWKKQKEKEKEKKKKKKQQNKNKKKKQKQKQRNKNKVEVSPAS